MQGIYRVLRFNILLNSGTFLLLVLILLSACNQKSTDTTATNTTVAGAKKQPELWIAPDTGSLGNSDTDQLIKYGKKLIENTGFYLGPKGTIAHISNGMNCQNCHLLAGTKPFGNNYSAVAANYPKFRERSGAMESIYKRVNDCVERSLAGHAIDTTSREMQAIKAYIIWLGKEVPKGTKPNGSGLTELAYLDQSADPEKGKAVYTTKCTVCHGANGEGKFNAGNITYQYPPLWGPHSYTMAAGLFRLSRLAGYVKSNMPFGADYTSPQLSDEEAWDVAAFVNSQQRPVKDISKDWPKISSKPVDHPFGPYADSFSEQQHKYGPFLPIAMFKKQQQKK
jgi:thiosulfate dehydrogenase